MAKTLRQYEERFQRYLEQLKVAEYNKANKVYQQLGKLLEAAIGELDGDLSVMRRSKLEAFLKSIRPAQQKMINDMLTEHKAFLESFAGYSYQIEASALAAYTTANIKHAAKARAIYQAALARPIGATGELLESFVDGLTSRQMLAIENLIRKGAVNGLTNAEVTRLLKGTKAKGYADGLMSRLGKQTATVVRTSTQHINNSARQVAWGDNSDLLEGYRWLSTLDSRTSPECQDRDGKVYSIGEGPVPPAHPNCRSTTIAVLRDSFAGLMEGATRSSVDGYVPLNMTYDQWRKTQP